MKLYTDKEAALLCRGWHLLLDNDFLSELFRDKEILDEFLQCFKESYSLIDPLTEFEFLRDVFEPEQRIIKERFIESDIFLPIVKRQETFIQLQENALLLSKMYSHKGHNKNTKISLVDLFLAARCMFNLESVLIITGNKRDFPNSIFKIIDVINIEQADGNIKPYSIIGFEKAKFDICYKDLQKMNKRYEEKIKKSI